MRRLSLSIYLLLAGTASGLALFFWHVWSDNAYLFVYFFSIGCLIAGLILALLSLRRLANLPWIKVVGILFAVSIISVGIVKGAGLDRALSDRFLAGGNGSQSPCLSQVRERAAGPAERAEIEQFRQSSSTTEVKEVLAFDQVLIPGLTGLMVVGAAMFLRRSREILRAKLVGDVSALAFISYLYLRGPSAWCGQLFGLDVIFAAALIGYVLIKFFPKNLLR